MNHQLFWWLLLFDVRCKKDIGRAAFTGVGSLNRVVLDSDFLYCMVDKDDGNAL